MGDRLEASQPFSYGPRGCLGKKYVIHPTHCYCLKDGRLSDYSLAALEMRLILAQMVWKYDIEWLNPSVDWERDNQGYTLWHRPELRVLFHERVSGIVLR